MFIFYLDYKYKTNISRVKTIWKAIEILNLFQHVIPVN